ncbi:hypothetical protein [Burkholderia gladioli]|uniref:hypothetical protein n=1 Tax=Burkholderia gladioli TaxID=28095 RepID=UPI00069AE251|nr:hypothetical protein [Burkholderia gladioli]
MPFGDFNRLLRPDAVENENDYVMLSDIFPTGYHATMLSGAGDSVVIYGAGPLGQRELVGMVSTTIILAASRRRADIAAIRSSGSTRSRSTTAMAARSIVC